MRQPELPDGAAVRTESRDPRRGADAVGAEVEIAIRPDYVHVREIQPGRDHRGCSSLGIELHDVTGKWVGRTWRAPHIDEVDVVIAVRRATGHMLDVRVGDKRGRVATHAVQVTGQGGDPESVVSLHDASGHLVSWERFLPVREVLEDADTPAVADEVQRVRSG